MSLSFPRDNGDDLSGHEESPGNYDFNLSAYSSKGTLLKESTVYNTSAQVVVFNSANDTLKADYTKWTDSSNKSYELAMAWY